MTEREFALQPITVNGQRKACIAMLDELRIRIDERLLTCQTTEVLGKATKEVIKHCSLGELVCDADVGITKRHGVLSALFLLCSNEDCPREVQPTVST